ncbi:hypothetical protein HN51_058239 [Arachis hypogaea]|uniref:Uncharacterized protein n=1 Tax=Arachis hypogaea TaxID=3818 RepID=A0A444X013_ARAHY|nr:uncharacterized protein DS421_20g686960 [Arachis hypogaea]RYQ83047.1 hypothetical protein Ahy_B10g101664 [Arachis hypogaea]RYR35365.1 hypothetical protein Ahy_A10g050531 [Arachis hypogaea]
MDNGDSWADQWDTHQDPPPSSEKDKKKGKDGSSNNNSMAKFGKAMISFKWAKQLRKKSQKNNEQ